MIGEKPVRIGDAPSNFDDITIQLKKRCAKIALDKIWLMPVKVWETVWDGCVRNISKIVVIPK